jgi:hypothetical protein
VVGIALHHLSRDREDLDPTDLISTGFELGEPIWVAEDMDMTEQSLMAEYPAEKAGWTVKDETLTRRSGAFRFALGFMADVYLGEPELVVRSRSERPDLTSLRIR